MTDKSLVGRFPVWRDMYSWENPNIIVRETAQTVYFEGSKYPRQKAKREILATFTTKDDARAFLIKAKNLKNIRDSRVGDADQKYCEAMKALIEDANK